MDPSRETIEKMVNDLGLEEPVATLILNSAIRGGETTEDTAPEWLKSRFKPNYIEVDKDEYAEMCVSALRNLPRTAPTDFGGSRQRDLSQLWADTTRGYLGEKAVVKFLKSGWGVEAELAHQRGELEEFLYADIHKVRFPHEEKPRSPKLKVGIKTVKFNGLWLDIPGAQYNHSNVHVLVKVGTGRGHLLAFFKEISVFKDKVLKAGIEGGAITEAEAKEVFSQLPDFRPVPAYICGFVERLETPQEPEYQGRMGRLHYTITAWKGPVDREVLNRIKEENNVPGRVEFEAIKKFTHDRMYLYNAGNLHWRKEDWDSLIPKL